MHLILSLFLLLPFVTLCYSCLKMQISIIKKFIINTFDDNEGVCKNLVLKKCSTFKENLYVLEN